MVADANVIVLALFFLIGHLQHTHVWIAFTGVWGRIILSPAHHQIHHSTNPAHLPTTNLGSFLAIWDWMFGTLLHAEQDAREAWTLRRAEGTADAHTVGGGRIAAPHLASSSLAREGPQPLAVAERSLGVATVYASAFFFRRGMSRGSASRGATPLAHDGTTQRADAVDEVEAKPARALRRDEVAQQRAVEEIDGSGAAAHIGATAPVVFVRHRSARADIRAFAPRRDRELADGRGITQAEI